MTWKSDPKSDELDAAIGCASCSSKNVWPIIERVETHATDGYDCPIGTRGDWIGVPFECENCGSHWRLIIGFHKGNTFLGQIAD